MIHNVNTHLIISLMYPIQTIHKLPRLLCFICIRSNRNVELCHINVRNMLNMLSKSLKLLMCACKYATRFQLLLNKNKLFHSLHDLIDMTYTLLSLLSLYTYHHTTAICHPNLKKYRVRFHHCCTHTRHYFLAVQLHTYCGCYS